MTYLEWKLTQALELIAAPKRPDGTYNRCREACEQLARATLVACDALENHRRMVEERRHLSIEPNEELARKIVGKIQNVANRPDLQEIQEQQVQDIVDALNRARAIPVEPRVTHLIHALYDCDDAVRLYDQANGFQHSGAYHDVTTITAHALAKYREGLPRCLKCDGSGIVVVRDPEFKGIICPKCSGHGIETLS